MSQILMKLEFSRHIFEKNSQISNFMKIRRIGAEWYNEPDFNGTRIFSTYFRKKSQITNFMKIR